MCNKVATPNADELQGYFDKRAPLVGHTFEVEHFDHYYNADLFLRPYLPITSGDNPRKITAGRWKLIPHWVKTDEEAKHYANTGNARSETIFDTPSYSHYITKNRCLLWVDGFFEPNHPKPKVTVPYYVRAIDRSPLALGCVYTDWVNQETGEVTRTFSIITTAPNELLRKIHNEGQRMPFIVTPENWDKWLGPLSKGEIKAMMQPLPDGFLEAFPVSNIIYKNRSINTPDVILPVE